MYIKKNTKIFTKACSCWLLGGRGRGFKKEKNIGKEKKAQNQKIHM